MRKIGYLFLLEKFLYLMYNASMKTNDKGIEIERKFLVAFPTTNILTKADLRIDIVQTYLHAINGVRRLRKCTIDGETTYVYTIKKDITPVTREEREGEIDEDTYLALMQEGASRTIQKSRYVYNLGNHKFELDVYPFFKDRAILEIELNSEDEEFVIPEFIKVIREVTGEKEYLNATLAENYGNE